MTQNGHIESLEKKIIITQEAMFKNEIQTLDFNLNKQFYRETFNQDLADIEWRLRQTRLNWNKYFPFLNQNLCRQIAKNSLSMFNINYPKDFNVSCNQEIDSRKIEELKLANISPEKMSSFDSRGTIEDVDPVIINGKDVISKSEFFDSERETIPKPSSKIISKNNKGNVLSTDQLFPKPNPITEKVTSGKGIIPSFASKGISHVISTNSNSVNRTNLQFKWNTFKSLRNGNENRTLFEKYLRKSPSSIRSDAKSSPRDNHSVSYVYNDISQEGKYNQSNEENQLERALNRIPQSKIIKNTFKSDFGRKKSNSNGKVTENYYFGKSHKALESQHCDSVEGKFNSIVNKDDNQVSRVSFLDEEESLMVDPCDYDRSKVEVNTKLSKRISALLSKDHVNFGNGFEFGDIDAITKDTTFGTHRKIDTQSTSDSNPGKNSQSTQINSITKSNVDMLSLKQMLLNQKVKLLADCAREEARRRKVNKLQRIIKLIEEEDFISVSEDHNTDSSHSIDSDREESCSRCSRGSSVNRQPLSNSQEPFLNGGIIRQTFRNQYYDSYRGSEDTRDNFKYNRRHRGQTSTDIISESIPQSSYKYQNSRRCMSPNAVAQKGKNNVSYPRTEVSQEKFLSLSGKDKYRIKNAVNMIQPRNKYESQNVVYGLYLSKIKNTSNGLSWEICFINQYDEGKLRVDRMRHGLNNGKEMRKAKSELQRAFASSMKSFILRSRQRQNMIKAAADQRKHDSQVKVDRHRLTMFSERPRQRINIVCQPHLNGVSFGVNRKPPIPQQRVKEPYQRTCETLFVPKRIQRPNSYTANYRPRVLETTPIVNRIYSNNTKQSNINNNRIGMKANEVKRFQSLHISPIPFAQ